MFGSWAVLYACFAAMLFSLPVAVVLVNCSPVCFYFQEEGDAYDDYDISESQFKDDDENADDGDVESREQEDILG